MRLSCEHQYTSLDRTHDRPDAGSRAIEVNLNKRVARDFFVFGLAAYGASWTIAEPLGAVLEKWNPSGIWYGAMVSTSIIVGLWKCRPRRNIEFKIPGSDSSIRIEFGDVFQSDNVVVIPVNEYFDGLLGDHVSERSLHGQFIKNVLGGQARAFYDLISKDLQNISSEEVHRERGRCSKYPIGTVARADVNGKRFLLAALSRTDLTSLKASATLRDLLDCLAGIWKGVRDFSNGNHITIPLLGSGLSGVGLPAKNLIDVIITSFLYYSKKQKIADRVTLVLPQRLETEIELITIKRSWTNGI